MSLAWALRPMIWRCGPQDVASDQLGDSLTGVCASLELPPPEPLDATRQDRNAEPGVADVLCVVSMGLTGLARAIALGGEEHGVLDRGLKDLVVMVLCASAAEPVAAQRIADHLAGRGVVAAIVLHPADPALAKAFLNALKGGESPEHAAAEARVRHPKATVTLSGPLLQQPLLAPRWRPDGAPSPSEDCAGLLHKAWQHARSRGSAYVGVEHIGEALLRRGASGPAASSLRSRLLSRGARLPRPWQDLQRLPFSAPDWRGTERLRALCRTVDQGLETWLRQLLVEARNPLARAAGVPLEPGPAAQALEVWAGPEDGRRLDMAPGDRLGRWVEGEPAQLALYADAAWTDPRLSPVALRWLGPGRVEVFRTVIQERDGQRNFVGPGELDLRAGDCVELTRGSWVMGVL